jgi:NitT/TauT family transport system permease protein
MRQLRKILLALVLPLSILILWSYFTYSGLLKTFFLPTPSSVFASSVKLFSEQNLLKDVIISLLRIFIGFFFAAILALPIGIGLGLSSKIESAVEPTMDFIRYTPIPAFLPLFILWFGIGEVEKIMVIIASVFFQLILMIANSISSTPRDMIDFAKTLGIGRLKVISRVILPYSAPKIFDDLRVSMGWAWSGLVLAEIVGSSAGIGYVIIRSQRLLQTGNVISAILIIGIFGVVTDLLLKKMAIVIFPWQKKHE